MQSIKIDDTRNTQYTHAIERHPKTNQRLVNKVFELIQNKKHILISGAGGTGKTYFIQQLKHRLETHTRRRITLTASTGIASVNINGITFHSAFGLNPNKEFSSIVKHIQKSPKRFQIINYDIVIVDEVSMLTYTNFEQAYTIIKECKSRYIPKHENDVFYGVQFIFVGDFLQLPPINDKWIFEHLLWKQLNVCPIILQTPKRFDDEDYFHFLMRVRKNQSLTKNDMKNITLSIRRYKQFEEDICNGIIHETDVKPTKLYSKRKNVEYQNKQSNDRLKQEKKTYYAKDDVFHKLSKEYKKIDHIQKKYLDKLASQKIVLCIGSQVMITSNIDVKLGLANGTRGVVSGFDMNGFPILKLKNPDIPNKTITPVLFEYEYGNNTILQRSQLPLQLSFALTIHKSQGSTLDFVVMDLSDVFVEGQVYVALSRCRNWNSLLLSDIDLDCICVNEQAHTYQKYIEENAYYVEEGLDTE